MAVSFDIQSLHHRVRPAGSAQPEGALILFHGRGADEDDLFPLIDVFEPERRLVGVTPRAPLQLPPGGFHWYRSAGIPTPDRETFFQTYELLGLWVAAFCERNEVSLSRTIIGGFSQGAVMTYAMSLGQGRPKPAGILAFSGFMPQVEGFELDLAGSSGLDVVVAHGTQDMVIPVEWGRQAKGRLEAAGAAVLYGEAPMGHSIDPGFASMVPKWIDGVISRVRE